MNFEYVERDRTYVMNSDPDQLILAQDPAELYVKVSQYVREQNGNQRLYPRHALLRDPCDIQFDFLNMCATRGVNPREFVDGSHRSWNLLTPHEQQYVHLYNAAYRKMTGLEACLNPDLCYNLTDNPLRRLTWTTANCGLPTFRKNTQFLFYPSVNSHLTRRERLATLGFPVFGPLSRVCCDGVMGTSMEETNTMIGNSMHLANATGVMAACLASLIPINERHNDPTMCNTSDSDSESDALM